VHSVPSVLCTEIMMRIVVWRGLSCAYASPFTPVADRCRVDGFPLRPRPVPCGNNSNRIIVGLCHNVSWTVCPAGRQSGHPHAGATPPCTPPCTDPSACTTPGCTTPTCTTPSCLYHSVLYHSVLYHSVLYHSVMSVPLRAVPLRPST